jgi:predicted Holliday junction resolvase-like endonuclease
MKKLGFAIGFFSVLIVFLAFGVIYAEQLKNRNATRRDLNAIVEQINEILLPELEETLQKKDKIIEALIKEDEKLKDNCSDIRTLLAPKLGRGVLMPLQRIPQYKFKLEKLHRIRYSRYL